MSTTFYQEMAEKSAVASFAVNLSTGEFIYVNQAFLSLLKIDGKDLTTAFIKDIVHEEDYDYVLKARNDLKDGNSSDQIQFRIILNEEVKWIRLIASVAENSKSGKLMYGNAIDITPETESQYVYQKYANKKNAILNILAHDLIGPLSVAKMLSSSLKSSLQSPEHVNQINSILKINQQSIDLIRQLTDQEFLETADIVLVKKRINISQKLKEYIEEYQKSSAETKRNFYFSSVPEHVFLSVDEPKLIQVMNNLMTNALKFTNENGQIAVGIEEKEDVVLFYVKDDGIGIPKEYHDVIFDKFTEASRKGLQGEPSIGLGMYVIKNIIEWHNGKVWMESEVNNGTTVYFTIPKS